MSETINIVIDWLVDTKDFKTKWTVHTKITKQIHNSLFYKSLTNQIASFWFLTVSVGVSVLVLSAVYHGFEPLSGQAKHYSIAICCFSVKHSILMSKSKYRLNLNQDDASDVSPRTVDAVIKIQLVVEIQSGHHHHHLIERNLFSPWYNLFSPWYSLFSPWYSLFSPWYNLFSPWYNLFSPWYNYIAHFGIKQ